MTANCSSFFSMPTWIETRPLAAVNQRNGYRTRPWDTRVGTIALEIPRATTRRHSTSKFNTRQATPRCLLSRYPRLNGPSATTERTCELRIAMPQFLY
jgi:hypothetical protein